MKFMSAFIALWLPVIAFGGEEITNQNNKLTNIALGKPYTFSVWAWNPWCKDPGDTTQLTDGKFSVGSFWEAKSSVGFHSTAGITIDLGSVQPIGGAAYSTAAEKGGICFPKGIFVHGSKDGKTFYYLGDLVSLSDEKIPVLSQGQQRFVFRTTRLKGNAQYVRFIIQYTGAYHFVDEIEVYRARETWKEPSTVTEVTVEKPAPISHLITMGTRIRLSKDIEQLRQKIGKANISDNVRKGLLKRLENLQKSAQNYIFTGDAKNFQTVVPSTDLQKKIMILHSELLSAEGFAPLTIWHKYHYAPLSLWESPHKKPCELNVQMMENEYRAEALNLTNATAISMQADIQISGLPNCIEVRQVEFVDTRNNQIISSPLLPVKKQGHIYKTTIAAGMTRQLWFTFHTHNIKPGTYTGNCIVTVDSHKKIIPLKLWVVNCQLSDTPKLKGLVWDFMVVSYFGITDKVKPAVLRDLKTHFVNCFSGYIPLPKANDVDSKGNLTAPIDFSAFENWLKICPGGDHYQVKMGGGHFKNFIGFTPGTPEFRNLIKQWMKAFDSKIRKMNLNPGQIHFNIVDEPRTPEEYQLLGTWVDAIKDASEMVHVWVDPLDLDKDENMKFAAKVLPKVDIVCPGKYKKETTEKFIRNLQKSGVKLWLYNCSGPTRNFDPSYYRLQAWDAFKRNALASCFWSYADQKCKEPWNEYTALGGLCYAIVFMDKNGPTPTKQWEALREGVEDYEYLHMLRKRISKLKNNGVNTPLIIEASELLSKAVNNTLKDNQKPNIHKIWTDKTCCRKADNERIKVLRMLNQLNEIEMNK